MKKFDLKNVKFDAKTGNYFTSLAEFQLAYRVDPMDGSRIQYYALFLLTKNGGKVSMLNGFSCSKDNMERSSNICVDEYYRYLGETTEVRA